MDGAVAPVLQVYEFAPPAVIVAEVFGQIVAELAVTGGGGFTVTVLVAEL
jgi:hypothetical protein